MISKTLQDAFLDQGDNLLIAVSGGADSMVLLHGLHRLGYQLTAAHFNHQLRPSSGNDELFVRQCCVNLGIPYRSGQGNVQDFAARKGLTLEEAARELRYQFLFSTAADLQADSVVTGHHANDQVETILMNIIRGAGPAGLTGMKKYWLPNPWSTSIALIRPLLAVWKEEITTYVEEQQLEYVQDPTNLDPAFLRNRIRHELIPLLAALNPGFDRHLLQTGEILTRENQLLQIVTDQAASTCLSKWAENSVWIDRERFLQEPLAIQRRIIRLIFHKLRRNEQQLSFPHIEQAVDFIQGQPSAAEENWVGKLNLVSHQDQVVIAGWGEDVLHHTYPQLIADDPLQVFPGKDIELGGEWVFQLTPRVLIKEHSFDFTQGPFRQWICADILEDALFLRRRKPGDRIQPLGMEGQSIKVADLMINEKIPARLRKDWPILATETAIIWIPGLRLGRVGKITPDTKAIVEAAMYQKGPGSSR